MATYLVGDIQGCYEPLQRLLEAINFDPAEDYIWSCGDLVNRGGRSLETLRLLHGIRDRVSVTLGNHDLHLLAAASKFPRGGCSNAEFDRILVASDREALIEWLAAEPLVAWSPEHRLLRMHAGVIPQWDVATTLARADEVHSVLRSHRRRKFLRKMYGSRPRRWDDSLRGWKRLRLITKILTQLRFCRPNGRADFNASGPPGSGKSGYKPWFKHKNRQTRDVRIAFGHWAALGLRVRKRYMALDSGCVWGGSLTAYRLEDDRVIQVRARPPA
ncbi:symmetrical bis(5'-nucleosyl)-tetraphosphatase [Marinihelvus fidelis]|uniref:bis(5'-nucleosyl)-tetraphosphatase (symmetrical) n=1 Tax=Marinihelvus fidelis TaxID=2613842 RepID=A0A5N0T5Z9_9GAMM|nr:symmetrical bis(5'-nucleosyl)-tetraphosphatase [Marinihelvus fidelis]KAA9130475.1 symmetrical bis(5'-nucleosyl)-tetraphosphatase [Marinihelvus fidelis]